MKSISILAVIFGLSTIVTGCGGGSNSNSTESIDPPVVLDPVTSELVSLDLVPLDLVGKWQRACSGNADSGYQIETLEFSETILSYMSQRFVDDTCQTENVDNPGSSSSGGILVGDLVITTSGVEARELDNWNDTFNSEPLDPIVISYNIYYIQDDVLYLSGGATEESERPNTLDFENGWMRQE